VLIVLLALRSRELKGVPFALSRELIPSVVQVEEGPDRPADRLISSISEQALLLATLLIGNATATNRSQGAG
jgi:hypothetical protein